MERIFKPCDICLPKDTDMQRWSVVACDQYTSEPEYWERVRKFVGEAPSTLKLTLPEAFLEKEGVDDRISEINSTMERYIKGGLFEEHKNCYILTERIARDSRVRYGVIGAVDLEAYDYNKGSKSPVRATEGTVLSRIPPRVKVRQNAPLELPHIMMLIDDKKRTAIEMLVEKKSGFEMLYNFSLMEDSGHMRGWLVTPEAAEAFDEALSHIYLREQKLWADTAYAPILFAMGDGNHSLATAKECYRLAKAAGTGERARYALCEVNNLHSEALDFEPIHRVIFDVDPKVLLHELREFYDLSEGTDGQSFTFIAGEREVCLSINDPRSNITAGSVQIFIDNFIAEKGGRCDYIHGDDVVRRLAAEKNTVGILLPTIDKSELFSAVIKDGALPRKTFSMGHAWDKRFYLEGRRIDG